MRAILWSTIRTSKPFQPKFRAGFGHVNFACSMGLDCYTKKFSLCNRKGCALWWPLTGNKRLREILARHPIWYSVKNRLREVIDDVGPKEKQGRRQGQVHFSLSRSGLVNGFDHYLTHGSEFDQHVVQRLFGDQSGLELLNSETVPVLVHVSFSGEQLIQGAHPHFSYSDVMGMGEIPGLARTFLNAWAYKAANPSFDIEKTAD